MESCYLGLWLTKRKRARKKKEKVSCGWGKLPL